MILLQNLQPPNLNPLERDSRVNFKRIRRTMTLKRRLFGRYIAHMFRPSINRREVSWCSTTRTLVQSSGSADCLQWSLAQEPCSRPISCGIATCMSLGHLVRHTQIKQLCLLSGILLRGHRLSFVVPVPTLKPISLTQQAAGDLTRRSHASCSVATSPVGRVGGDPLCASHSPALRPSLQTEIP